MSTGSWPLDIFNMHSHYGVHGSIDKMDSEKLRKFLEFRLSFLREELDEIQQGVEAENPEDIIDGLIDLCVVAIGTLDAFEVNADLAWRRVHEANMRKKVGVKESRPNPLGLPDLVKPDDWTPPTHLDNHGLMWKAFGK